jgi:hyaluronate lyase
MLRLPISARWTAVLLAVALAFAPVNPAGAADELSTVRANFFAFYTGAGAVATDAGWQSALARLESDARQFSRVGYGYLNSNGSWSDLRYDEIPSGGWPAWDHFRRLTLLAKAYRTPGQSLYGDPQLRQNIENAVAFIQTFYAPNSDPPGNWWFWRIGAPLDLGPTLVLMQDALPPAVLDPAVRSLSSYIGSSPWYYPPATALKGQNLVWSAYTHLCLALLKNDDGMLRASRDAIASVSRPVVGREGIQNDSSFHQHGAQLYTGGYGGSYAHDAGRFSLLTRGTPYAMPEENLATAAGFVVEGISWGMYRNHFDVSIIGREVSKPWTNGYNGITALLQMSEVPSARQAEIRSACAESVKSWSSVLPTELEAIASRFRRSGAVASAPSGNRVYSDSDYVVHRRPGYFASVKMFSSRTKSGERTNGENILGSRQSDGRFYLVQSGNEFFGADVFPVLDWSRLSGITVEQSPTAAGDVYGTGTKSFVGGATDGRLGVAAMDLAPVGSALRAKKAWIFLDDAIVFLTTGVELLNGNRAETIVHQWPLSRADAPLVVDGRQISSTAPWSGKLSRITWAAADGVGYYFPLTADVQAKREMRSGSWSQLGSAAPDATVHTKPVLTLWYDHGDYVTAGRAEYVIIPNATPTSMASWAAGRPVTVLRNDDSVSAARDQRNGATGIVFWKPSTVDGISSDRPAIVHFTRDRGMMKIHVADPTQATATVRLVLPGAWKLSSGVTGAAATRDGGVTILTVPVSSGRTSSVVLAEAKRNRTVRR